MKKYDLATTLSDEYRAMCGKYRTELHDSVGGREAYEEKRNVLREKATGIEIDLLDLCIASWRSEVAAKALKMLSDKYIDQADSLASPAGTRTRTP